MLAGGGFTTATVGGAGCFLFFEETGDPGAGVATTAAGGRISEAGSVLIGTADGAAAGAETATGAGSFLEPLAFGVGEGVAAGLGASTGIGAGNGVTSAPGCPGSGAISVGARSGSGATVGGPAARKLAPVARSKMKSARRMSAVPRSIGSPSRNRKTEMEPPATTDAPLEPYPWMIMTARDN
ncbi:hypothetical protein BH09VER1_BH09VER1_43780 [soil metagenome]